MSTSRAARKESPWSPTSAAVEGRTLSVSFGGVDATGDVSLLATNGALSTELLASGVVLEAGVQAVRVFAGGGPGALELEAIRGVIPCAAVLLGGPWLDRLRFGSRSSLR
jgi:hypothetical protein